jgi:glycosyltransferase involved in cell wall biosynthesis
MKVLLLAPSRSIHTHKWAMFYKSKGIDVRVASFENHFSEENSKDVMTYKLSKKLPGKLSYLTSVGELKTILKEFKPDILHAHYASSYGLVGALTRFTPYVISVWGSDIFEFPRKNVINKLLLKFSLSKANFVCSTSVFMANETKNYTTKQIEITPFGVNNNIFKVLSLPKSNDITVFGVVKSLSDRYGFSDLFKAFSILSIEYENIELVVVGDGECREKYEHQIQNLGIQDKVRMIGRVQNEDVPKYLNEMDIFVLPSIEDSFGVAAVEAMACGTPVIVSDAGGLQEVVIEGETGYIVPMKNPEKLALAMEKLLIDKDLQLKFSTNGVQHVTENYDWKENANRMLGFYKKHFNI